MITVIYILIAFIVVLLLYKYFPRQPLPKWTVDEVQKNKETVVLDVRDYNISYKTPIEGAYNLPSAYIKRYYSELPNKALVLATIEPQSVRVDVRFLQRKGFNIVGIVDMNQGAMKTLAKCS
jgi:hypothetical protein